MGARARGRPRGEWWSLPTLVLLVLLVGTYLYLGSRPGGSGPIWVWVQGRFLLALAALALLVAAVLWSLTHPPFLQGRRGRSLVGLVLVVAAAPFPLPYPSSHEGHPSGVVFRLPVEGEWIVAQGGDRRGESLLAAMTHDQRWGILLVKGEPGEPGDAGDPGDPERSPSFGEPVLAAAGGRVVRVRGGIEDSPTTAGPDPAQVPPHGNLVVIEVAPGEYLFTTHLAAGSIRVTPGEVVAAGAELGRVGYSGHFPFLREPHVAIHLQGSPRDRWGEAIPWRFGGYLADGRAVERGLPRGGRRGGERVRALP